jgi:type II secretory ATPase GspE/PulE/Tfp pilus assembly ATPase PilB-like protein
MGDPVKKVVANRLVQFCCDHCATDFDASPAKFIAMLDKGEAPAESAEHKAKHEAEHGEHHK